jgi:hypothetical protein
MTNKVFECVGKRVLIVEKYLENCVEGWQGTIAESSHLVMENGVKALDFVEPIYEIDQKIEELAKGQVPKERIDPRNPILHFYFSINPSTLIYKCEMDLTYKDEKIKANVFEPKNEDWYSFGGYLNDGNTQEYRRYAKYLKKAGFKIYRL